MSDYGAGTVWRKMTPKDSPAKSESVVLYARRQGIPVETTQKYAPGTDEQHVTTKNTTKSDREAEEQTKNKTIKKKNKKSSGALRKARYLKAKHILAKVYKNEMAGITHERDAADKVTYEAVVREYEAMLSNKSNDHQKNIIPQNQPPAMGNRSQDVSGRAANFQGFEGPTNRSKDVSGRAANCQGVESLTNRSQHVSGRAANFQGFEGPTNRSQDVSGHAANCQGVVGPTNRSQHVSGRDANCQAVESPTTSAAATASEGTRDHLQVALVDAKSYNGRRVLDHWGEIEARLSGMVVEYLMANKGQVPLFDSAEVCRGCRVIRCADEFSKRFLEKCVAEVSNAWEGISLKLIPASDIPKRPRARIWLPKLELDGQKVLQCLKLQNPEVPMHSWSVIKLEEPQKNSSTVLLLISNDSLDVLEQKQYKLRFGLRMAKVKVLPASVTPDGDFHEIEDTKQPDELWLSATDAVPEFMDSMTFPEAME